MNFIFEWEKTLSNYLNNQITMHDYIKQITILFTQCPKEDSLKELDKILKINKNRNDKEMLAYFILWILPTSFFQYINEITNIASLDEDSYFLYSIFMDYPELLHEPFEIVEDNELFSIYQKGKMLIILNPLDKEQTIPLPTSDQNRKCFCVNCNDEMMLEQSLWISEYSFYLLLLS